MARLSAAAPEARVAPPLVEESSTLSLALAELLHESDDLRGWSFIFCLLLLLRIVPSRPWRARTPWRQTPIAPVAPWQAPVAPMRAAPKTPKTPLA
eukprot:11178436-Heterocapsa_arctica.AAC.1